VNGTPRRFVVLAGPLSCVALTACGGSSGSSDKDQLTAIIKDIGNKPADLCTKYATAQLLAQAGGKAACLKAAAAPNAADPHIKVDTVAVSGDTATAQITGNTGNTTLSFSKSSGAWKLTGSK
jgi:hypothetical protein